MNHQISAFLTSKIRKTDLLFRLTDGEHWGIFFLQSSEVEVKAFLKRIFAILKQEREYQQITLKASITEIRNNSANFETLLDKNKRKLANDEQPIWSIEQVTDYRVQPMEQVKVSIIEQNAIFRKVLETTFTHLDIPHFTLDVATYEDGYSFYSPKPIKQAICI